MRTSGAAVEIRPVAWQPGLAIRRCRPVRCRRINDAHLRVLDHRNRFYRTRVRKAQEHNVCGIEKFLPLGRIMPLIFIDPQELEILPLSDPFVDFKTGRSALSVNINLCLHPALLPPGIFVRPG